MTKFTAPLLILLMFVLQGCSHGFLSDQRSISQQLTDDNLSLKALDKINELNIHPNNIRFNILTNAGYILIIGQVESNSEKQKIERQLSSIKGNKGVYNQLRIGKPIGFTQRTTDSWITARVKTKLSRARDVNTFQIKVITENSEVFLIGSVTKEIADDATNIARKISSIKQVNRVFHITGK